jgi:5'-3' exoribonuclease 1
VASYKFTFDLGQPFKPFEQLMGVLPELSSSHVPPAFRVSFCLLLNFSSKIDSHEFHLFCAFIQDLMTNSESPIIDLYPQNFETDLNGKKYDWEAIVKIPFIDQDRLLKAMKG